MNVHIPQKKQHKRGEESFIINLLSNMYVDPFTLTHDRLSLFKLSLNIIKIRFYFQYIATSEKRNRKFFLFLYWIRVFTFFFFLYTISVFVSHYSLQ